MPPTDPSRSSHVPRGGEDRHDVSLRRSGWLVALGVIGVVVAVIVGAAEVDGCGTVFSVGHIPATCEVAMRWRGPAVWVVLGVSAVGVVAGVLRKTVLEHRHQAGLSRDLGLAVHLEQLQGMHAEGMLDDQEYAQARAAVLRRAGH